MQLSPYVLRRRFDNGELYFNSKTNHSFFITEDLINQIVLSQDLEQQFNDYLCKNKYFEVPNEFEHAFERIKENEDSILECTILTHGDCNFRCKYCYEKFENIGMSEEVEERILSFINDRFQEKKFEGFHVSWFGGEPLLGLKTIKRLSKKMKQLCLEYDVKFFASMTTNASLLNRRIFNTLVNDYEITSYQITIDGDEEGHDFQRVLSNGRGSYQKILKNLIMMSSSNLDFSCALRFNISEENYDSIERFLDNDGNLFRKDHRFRLYFYNVGNWGCGNRTKDYKVTIVHTDASFELAKMAINKGFNVPIAKSIITNLFNCYANRRNHYTFNVRGVIQTCTVALYSRENIFGTVLGKFNKEKFKNWHLDFDLQCLKCPVALICKSGYCPPVHRNNKNSKLCINIKEKINRNLELFVLNREYNDYLDVDRRGGENSDYH